MKALIQYIQGLEVTQGDLVGEGVTVFPWERKFLKGAFAPGVSTSALSIGRGNGKTSLIAAIAAAALDGPLAQPRSEILLVASTLSQARIAYHHVLAFLGDPKANKRQWATLDSPQKCEITNKTNGVLLRCISSKPEGAHGAAAGLVIADEPAQWAHNTRDAMLAALETGLGKIPNSRMVALGTQPEDPEHWFSGWLAGRADYCQVHAATDSDEVHHKKTWRKANPSMDYLPSLAKAIARDSGKAKTDSRSLQAFKSLRLNLPVADTTAAELLTPGELSLCETDSLPEREGLPVFGVDLGATAAMSACAAYWSKTGLTEVLGFFPSIPSLKERGRV